MSETLHETETRTCSRCKRVRPTELLLEMSGASGHFFKCLAKKSCARIAKANRLEGN